MRNFLVILFGTLTVLSAIVWIVGALTAAVLPWFGGIRAERIGEIGTAIFICGDGFIYGFGWLTRYFARNRKPQTMGLPGPRRYGNKKPIA